jgi:hypothetical protein
MVQPRHALSGLRCVLVAQRQMFDRAVEPMCAPIGGESDVYYRDVGDHLSLAFNEAEAARESLLGVLDTYTN